MTFLLSSKLDYPDFAELDGPIAIIDIGSNSIRLVIFDAIGRTPATLFNEKVTCGLGRSIGETGRLSTEGVELALPNLQRFAKLAQSLGVAWTVCLATAAVRDAEDGPDFVEQVAALCGLSVTVLTGNEEALLSASGVISAFPFASGLIADLGGGSVELVEVNNGILGQSVTLPLGTLYLMNLGRATDKKVRKEIDRQLEQVNWLSAIKGNEFYTVGGSWRNLARLTLDTVRYPLHIVNGYQLPVSAVRDMVRVLGRQTSRSLDGIRSISKRRLEALPYGALLMERIIAAACCRGVTFTAQGLREGFIHDCSSEQEQSQDPLLQAAKELALRDDRLDSMGPELFDWTSTLFDSETMEQKRLRQAACWLADIGWREHPDYRGAIVFNWILQYPFLAIDHPGRVFLAYSLLVRYGNPLKDDTTRDLLTLLSSEQLSRARILGAALRLAFRVSAVLAENLRRSSLEIIDGQVELSLPNDGSLPDGKAVQQGLSALNKALRQNENNLSIIDRS
ncbi:MAG: Ppx/GppA phosphatase family protein [Pseudomonadota bacterium]